MNRINKTLTFIAGILFSFSVYGQDNGISQLQNKYLNDESSQKAENKEEKKVVESDILNYPAPLRPSSGILSEIKPSNQDNEAYANQNQQIPIMNSLEPKRGINIKSEAPSNQHILVSPASKGQGGDDVEIVISQVFNTILEMPSAIEYVTTSSSTLRAEIINTNPRIVKLSISSVSNPVPTSLHLIDVNQDIYTFTVIAAPVDLANEYAKTIIVTKRRFKRTKIGYKNPQSVIDAMDVEDAIQIVVGDKPNTSEYDVEFISGRYMHYEGYAQYSFRISRGDKKDIARENETPKLQFTIWANDRKLDGGTKYSLERNIEWVIEPLLSQRESRRKGYDVLRVFVQLRASLLDLETWRSAFITVSDNSSYTRFDFPPLIRDFRAPPRSNQGEK